MDLPTQSLLVLWAVLFVLSTVLVCHFASPTTRVSIKLLVIVSFVLGFSGVALLPIDLTITTVYNNNDSTTSDTSNSSSSSASGNDDNPNASSTSSSTTTTITPNATFGPWQVVYWSTFLLGFLILPLIRESILSGHFTFRTRLVAGCRKALRGYLVLLLVGLIAIIAMVIKLGTIHVVPVLMSLANTYGLLLVSLLLGYGLVDLPAKLWRQANPEVELRRTQIIASNADEHLFEAVWELQDCETMIDAAATRIGDYEENGNRMLPMDPQYARCVDKLLTLRKSTAVLTPDLQRRRTTSSNNNRRVDERLAEDNEEGYPSVEYLAILNRRLQHAQNELVSAEQQWLSVVHNSEFYAELVEGTRGAPSSSSFLSQVRFIWLKCLRRPWFKCMGMACAVLSVAVLWSEATLSLPFNVSPFALFLRLFDKNRGPLFQLSALIPFLYMSICVYSSLFKLSLFGPYRLRGQRMSAGIALVFNAQYLVRLQFPLGYNYLLMIKYDTSTTDCAFSHVMRTMDTVPFFGTNFAVYAPLLILALCGFTLCNGYARLLTALGMEHEDAILMGDRETLDTKVNEGITLLRRSGGGMNHNNSHTRTASTAVDRVGTAPLTTTTKQVSHASSSGSRRGIHEEPSIHGIV